MSGTLEELVYNRQIYKEQMANAGTTTQKTKRYFEAMQGEAGKEGELFGLANIFRFASCARTDGWRALLSELCRVAIAYAALRIFRQCLRVRRQA